MKSNGSNNGQGVLNRKCKKKNFQDCRILFNRYYSSLFAIVVSWNRNRNPQRFAAYTITVPYEAYKSDNDDDRNEYCSCCC